MATVKVTKASPNAIELDNGLILGANKHPNYFKSESGFRVPTVKVGDTVEIPDEAISVSSNGRKYVIGDLTIDQLQKQLIKTQISTELKKARIAEMELADF